MHACPWQLPRENSLCWECVPPELAVLGKGTQGSEFLRGKPDAPAR